MNESFWQDIFTFSQELIESIEPQLLQYFGHTNGIDKGDGSLVTIADQWSDEQIQNAIRKRFPDHGILTEETQHIFPDSEWCWIIDPIDGTTNFTRGIPLWGVSLGLLYKGVPVFGYIHFPNVKQTFHGYYFQETSLQTLNPHFDLKTLEGAYLNQKRIHSSLDQPSGNHFFNLCARSLSILQQKLPCKVRMLGVATYNVLLVANGTALGGVEATPKVWDMAGVYPIIKASGAQFVSLSHEPLFPLKKGENYRYKSCPILVVAREDLIPVFLPFVSGLKQS